MTEQSKRYQSIIDKVYDWLEQSARQDVLTMMDILERAKAYLHAAEDLGVDELKTMENFLLRDFNTFSKQLGQQAEDSLWLKSIKNKLGSLLVDMSDQNRLQMFEMEVDVAHQGQYKAGELVALGEIVCSQCGHRHQVDFVEEIQPCIECGGTEFSHNQPLT